MSEDNEAGNQKDQWGTWAGGKDVSKPEPKLPSRRDFLKAAGAGAAAVATHGVVGDALVGLAQTVDVQDLPVNQELPAYSECLYTLEEDSLRLRARLENGAEQNLDMAIIRKDLPVQESEYTPSEFEIEIRDDEQNPNYNCHSFALGQITGIEEVGVGSNVWVDNPEMRNFFDTFGNPVFDTGNYGQEGFALPPDPHEGDLLALIDQAGEVVHTGVYHTEFNGVDTSFAPYISKFGSDKLMGRGLEHVTRWYWANQPNDTDQLKMVVYRFDESFNFAPDA